jgi:transposase-like protein
LAWACVSLTEKGYKDRKQVASSLKQIYQSISEDEALLALDEFEHGLGMILLSC